MPVHPAGPAARGTRDEGPEGWSRMAQAQGLAPAEPFRDRREAERQRDGERMSCAEPWEAGQRNVSDSPCRVRSKPFSDLAMVSMG